MFLAFHPFCTPGDWHWSDVLFTGVVSLHTCHLLSIYDYFTLCTIMRYSMDDLTMSALQSQFMFEAKLHLHFSNELPWEIDCALQSFMSKEMTETWMTWQIYFMIKPATQNRTWFTASRQLHLLKSTVIMCYNCT